MLTNWLDYLDLGIDAAERLYIELNYKESQEKDFQRFVNTLYFAIDAVFASTLGAGGGGLATRGSHELAVAGWRATPNSVKLKIQQEVAKRMGWSVAKAAQMTNVFFSEINGGGRGGSNGHDTSSEGNTANERPRISNEEEKSIRSLERRIVEHEQKLQEYRKKPMPLTIKVIFGMLHLKKCVRELLMGGFAI